MVLGWYLIPPCTWFTRWLGCAHFPPAPRISGTLPPTDSTYRFSADDTTATNSNRTLIVLVFSGGGTRAAAFSFGVLKALEQDSVVDQGRRESLLDEVDMISSVSGGSFTAAYYGLYGKEIFTRFPDRFLRWNAQRRLAAAAANPVTNWRLRSSTFSRIDLAAEAYADRLFGDSTFAALKRRKRPFIVLNSTDMVGGTQFSFTNEFFAPLCLDLLRFPVARAVAASSAFPGLLTAMTLDGHPGTCGYRPPRWVLEAVASTSSTDSLSTEYDRAIVAQAHDLLSYHDSAVSPRFVHLLDGGLSDNLGGRVVYRALNGLGGDASIAEAINEPALNVLFILANARTRTGRDLDLMERTPGVLRVLQTVADAPMSSYTDETIRRIEESVAQRNRLRRARYFVVHLEFDGVRCARLRNQLLAMQTSFSLDSTSVDKVVDVAGRLLRENASYRQFLGSAGGVAHASAATACGSIRHPSLAPP